MMRHIIASIKTDKVLFLEFMVILLVIELQGKLI